MGIQVEDENQGEPVCILLCYRQKLLCLVHSLDYLNELYRLMCIYTVLSQMHRAQVARGLPKEEYDQVRRLNVLKEKAAMHDEIVEHVQVCTERRSAKYLV